MSELLDRLNHVEEENKQLKSLLAKLEGRLSNLEKSSGVKPAAPAPAAKPAPAPAAKPAKADDDFDLFDDDEEEDSAEKKRITEERLAAYNAKKSGKTALVAKSSILLDVKV